MHNIISSGLQRIHTKALVHRHLESGARYVPATRQRFRGVNCTLLIGVRFVGNVDSRSALDRLDISRCIYGHIQGDPHVSLSPPEYLGIAESPLLIEPFSCGFPPADFTSQHRTVQSAPPLTRSEDSSLKAREYIEAACPVIFLIRRPEPRSHKLMARSSPKIQSVSLYRRYTEGHTGCSKIFSIRADCK